MAITRVVAFKKDDGTYWIINSTGTMLISVNADAYTDWMSAAQLTKYTATQLRLVSGLSLCIHTSATDDEYTVTVKEYGIEESTDDTSVNLKGFAGITSVTATATGDCRYAFSFDGRSNWYTYNTTQKDWVKIRKEEIIESGMTTTTLNSLKTEWAKIFTRTNLDYAIAIPSDATFTALNFAFPKNSAPSILSVTLSGENTHKDDINLNVKVEDVDGDDMSYKIYLNDSAVPHMQGDVNPLSHGNLNFTFAANDLIVGSNKVRILMSDEKGDTSEKATTIIRSNDLPQLSAVIDNDILSFTFDDSDGDTVQYTIYLNDEVIVPETDFETVPFSKKINIPRDKIKFGEKNHIKFEYQDDIKEKPLCSQDLYFEGYYYGVLFVADNTGVDKKDSKGNKTNERFYSDSLGNILNKLLVKNLYRNKQSSVYEIFVLNRGNEPFKTVTVKPQVINKTVVMELSEQRTPFAPKEEIVFSNMAYDEYRSFYVRLEAKDNFTGNYSNMILAEAANS